MDTLMEYTCLSISPAFPRVGGEPDHVSSQGKEAVFATHDIYILLYICDFIFVERIPIYNEHIKLEKGSGLGS